MSQEIAIQVTNLSKCYHIYKKPQDRLKQFFTGKNKYCRKFHALRDVSFTLPKGASLGIIGRNGSGKSTLLQLICNTLTPTSGQITTQGRIAALLELGAGFNREFTGRENIYFTGAILGFSRQEIDQRLPAILDFADIGDFIDQPVKTYSSGMYVRLAFAVQTSIDPDILIIDEALSVGDIFFRQKCIDRIQQLRARGITLIFVSHDMSMVRDLCETALYLQAGKMIFFGPSDQALKKYYTNSNEMAAPQNLITATHTKALPTESIKNKVAQFRETAIWVNNQSAVEHNPTARLVAVALLNAQNEPSPIVRMGSKLKIQVLYQSYSDQPIHVSCNIRNRYNHMIYANGSHLNDMSLPILTIGEYAIFELIVDCMIEAGEYTFGVSLSYRAPDLPHGEAGVALDTSPELGPIIVKWDYHKEKPPWLGQFGLPTNGQIFKLSEEL